MLCSLFGLSPIDVVRFDIESSVVKGLIELLNTRFEIQKLNDVKLEFSYYYDLFKSGPVMDYVNREDRVSAKKISAGVSIMTAFGDATASVKEQLKSAPVEFTGKFHSKRNGTVNVSDPASLELIKLVSGKYEMFKTIADSIQIGEFHDEKFFGRSLSNLSSLKNASFFYFQAYERLENNDDIEKLLQDSVGLMSYINTSHQSRKSFEFISTSYLEGLYRMFFNEGFSSEQSAFLTETTEFLKTTNYKALSANAINSLFIALVYTFISDKLYNPRLQSDLEMCDIYSENAVKSSLFLNMVKSLSFVSEGKAQLNTNASRAKAYTSALIAIIEASENRINSVGPLKEGD